MARGRFISESVATDARLNSLSVEAQLVYLMTVPHLDRDGRIEGDPDVLWGKVCPKRRQFLDRMATFIQEWAKAGLVQCYDTDEGVVLWFKGFTKNQQGMRYDREAPSKFPPPPNNGEPVREVDAPPCEPTPDKLPTNSGNCPAEVKDQGQVKDKDQSSSPLPPSPPAHDDDDSLAYAAVIKAWEANIGVVAQHIGEQLAALMDEVGPNSVIHGIHVATEANVRTYRYVQSCARNHAAGIEQPVRQANGVGHRNGVKLSEQERSAILTRAKNAQASLRTAEKFGGQINPQWQEDISKAREVGVL
jgi:hypothetical protein